MNKIHFSSINIKAELFKVWFSLKSSFPQVKIYHLSKPYQITKTSFSKALKDENLDGLEANIYLSKI